MSRLLTTIAFVALLGASLIACDVDFTEPTTTPPRVPLPSPARLSANIHMESRDAPHLRFHAGLVPGVKGDGSFRSVSDDTLRLGGMPLTPDTVHPEGQRSYRWSSGRGTVPDLRLEPPLVQGTAETPPPVEFRTYVRAGADTLLLAPGDTLRLDVATLGSASDLLQRTSWTLHLIGSDGSLTIRRHDTPPPPALRVPAEWLEWAVGEELRASLSVQEYSTFDPIDGDYQLSLAAASIVEWVVRWAEPAATADARR